MITEALAFLLEQNAAEHRVGIIEAPDYERTGRYFAVTNGEAVERFEERRPDELEVFTVSDLCRALSEEVERWSLPGRYCAARITYSRKMIHAEVTTGLGEDVTSPLMTHGAYLELREHPAFAAVAVMRDTMTFTQGSLVRFLRATLNGHVDDSLVETFRALRLTTVGHGESVMGKGREAVDESIMRELQLRAGAQVPDSITVTVPVYDLRHFRTRTYPITVLIEATPGPAGGAPHFELTTVTSSLMDARDGALDDVISVLMDELEAQGDDEVPVLFARPG